MPTFKSTNYEYTNSPLCEACAKAKGGAEEKSEEGGCRKIKEEQK